jgi:hypothetical protein
MQDKTVRPPYINPTLLPRSAKLALRRYGILQILKRMQNQLILVVMAIVFERTLFDGISLTTASATDSHVA